MGFRTVVMLSNDRAHEWSKDAKLGEKILHGSALSFAKPADIDNYGKVVECVHADTNTLAILSNYDNFRAIGYGPFCMPMNSQEAQLAILREAAANMGYTLAKKRQRR